MKFLLLDVINEKVEVVEIEPKLDEYYRLIQTDVIDIVERKIGGKYFDIICDDEGVLKENPKISAISDMGEPMLVGNLIFSKVDGGGYTIGLTQDEIDHISEYVQKMYTRNYPNGYLMLTQCEF